MAAPEPIKAAMAAITQQFQKVKPGFAGPITPVESVEAQLKVIAGLTEKDNGGFLSHHGDKNWL
jgi:hypothetical protein